MTESTLIKVLAVIFVVTCVLAYATMAWRWIAA
jgi:hypothetical protein